MRVSIDELEAEQGDVEPFELDLGEGWIIQIPHPEDVPAADLLNLDMSRSPAQILRMLMGDDAFDAFVSHPKAKGGVLKRVFERYTKHYGLGSPGEGVASPPSWSGSAGQSKQTLRREGTT